MFDSMRIPLGLLKIAIEFVYNHLDVRCTIRIPLNNLAFNLGDPYQYQVKLPHNATERCGGRNRKKTGTDYT